jgi:hypothetical protein
MSSGILHLSLGKWFTVFQKIMVLSSSRVEQSKENTVFFIILRVLLLREH